MPHPDNPPFVTWRLRELMAAAGMFKTTDLVEPLKKAGINLSREQVFRLVTKTPARLNMEVLAALCTVLHCTPNDLIEITATSTQGTKTTASGETSGPSIGDLRPIPARIHRPRRA